MEQRTERVKNRLRKFSSKGKREKFNEKLNTASLVYSELLLASAML